MGNNVPPEVVEHTSFMHASLEDALRGARPPIDPDRIAFYLKAEISRGEAWLETAALLPYDGKNNPWRKCHTEHYWVWVHHGEKRCGPS